MQNFDFFEYSKRETFGFVESRRSFVDTQLVVSKYHYRETEHAQEMPRGLEIRISQ